MMKISSPLTTITNCLSHSLRRIILVTLIVVSLIPFAFILPSIGDNSLDSVLQDNLQKHKLLATSLVEPIQLKIESYQHELKLLDITLQSLSFEKRKIIQETINKFTNSHDMVSVSLLLQSNRDAPIIEVRNSFKNTFNKGPIPPEYIEKAIRYQKYTQENNISPITKSSFSKTPVILIKHQIIDKNSIKIGTLFAEIEPEFIKRICSNISFGNNGFCTIIDGKSNVIAHPNQSWVAQTHNLFSHKLVQTLKSNNIGSLEYLSPTDNSEMIGGYAKIKKLNWGVLITRPKSEITLPLNNARENLLVMLSIGLVIALSLAIFVIIFVTRPLIVLSTKIKILTQKQNTYSLGNAPKNSPSDISFLWKTLSDLLVDYQELNRENILLESSSKKDIRKVMGNRRELNIKKDNNIDPTTGLTNITCFLKELNKILLIYRGESAGLIIIEVDNYKPLIERGKAPLANHIIKHVAQILNASKRNDDMVTRYGTEGYFAIFISDCNPKALQGMAKKLRLLVEVSPILWEQESVYINLSTGIVAHKINEKTTANALMSLAERALVSSKVSDENKISTHNNDKKTQTSK